MPKLNLLLAIISILINFPLCSQSQIDSNGILKLMTFNIYHGETMKGDFDFYVIADVIKNANPDFVALQEVDYKTNRAHKLDLATELGWRTRMVPLFGRAMSYDGGEYGCGILSKYSILKSRNIPLPYPDGYEPRTALEITAILNSGDTIAFIGTHLDHTRNDSVRFSQAEKIVSDFSPNDYPTILAGDLNDIPGSRTIELPEKYWTNSYNNELPKPTYPSENPSKKIDYVLFSPKENWKVLKTEVIQDKIASDHCAYLVTIQLNNRITE